MELGRKRLEPRGMDTRERCLHVQNALPRVAAKHCELRLAGVSDRHQRAHGVGFGMGEGQIGVGLRAIEISAPEGNGCRAGQYQRQRCRMTQGLRPHDGLARGCHRLRRKALQP
jgi:hypothetical protein